MVSRIEFTDEAGLQQVAVEHDELLDPVDGSRRPGPTVWTPPFEDQSLAGRTIELSLPELGLHGDAHVLSIGACPQISPRPGPEFQLVTATYTHSATNVLDLQAAGEPAPIGVTGNHPFWSVDQRAFVAAEALTRGERLQRADGSTTVVASVAPRPGRFVRTECATRESVES